MILSTVWLRAACCGKTHPGSVRCCRNVGFSASEGTHYLYPSFYSILLKWLFYLANCCWAFLWRSRKSPALSLPLSHPPCSTGNSTYCRYTTGREEQENHNWEHTTLQNNLLPQQFLYKILIIFFFKFSGTIKGFFHLCKENTLLY